ncbi:hypothetical protein [Paenibacillus dakarensis]|uniref:hypothetical protein n=1 Tax=Paenibacillus dakarensis TaxID=1527293 RepID=UPI0006D565FE|nr:hypothetical protein [Paenibacillus dakarensis]
MRKLITVMVLLASISIVGCTDNQEADADHESAPGSTQETAVTDQEIDSLRKENDELKTKVAELETQIKDQETARVLLNQSFKIISAMEKKDYNYLKSVAGPDVTISEKDNKIITEKHGEYKFLVAPMDKLEYRGGGYPDGSNDQFHIFLATVSTEEGNEGSSEIYMHFVKVNNEWKYDGYITN